MNQIQKLKPSEMKSVDLGGELLNEVLSYLKAHPFRLIQTALKQWRVESVAERDRNGWRPWTKTREDIPEGMEWRQIGTKLQVRPPRDRMLESDRALVTKSSQVTKPARPKGLPAKTDLSAKQVEKLRCPDCGGGLYQEAICPGCADGRKGKRIRLLCGECDYTETL